MKVTLKKAYIFQGDKGKKTVEANVETELTDAELKNVDKADILTKEEQSKK